MRASNQIRNFHITMVLVSILAIVCFGAIPCQQYQNGQCIRCPTRSHLYQKQCYNDILGCISYINGSICNQCDSSISVLTGNNCTFISSSYSSISIEQLRLMTTLGDQYGSPSFVKISIQEAINNTHFQRCDNFMRNSAYSFHISPAINPLISVHTYIVDIVQHFKILYEGAGGGLFLCIIQTDMNKQSVTLSSFVAIGKSNIIDNCVDYDIFSNCNGCEDGYHLDNKICYKNIGDCVSYIKTLCLECIGFNVLLQNRCIGYCTDLSDCMSNVLYFNTASQQAVVNQIGQVMNISSSTNSPASSSTSNSPTPINTNNFVDPYCAVFGENKICLKCSFRFFMNSNKICEAVSPLCRTFDQITGNCLTCYQGFNLLNGQCS